jgi:hypothetical protein
LSCFVEEFLVTPLAEEQKEKGQEAKPHEHAHAHKHEKKAFSGKDWVKIAILFVVSYAVLWALGNFGLLGKWDSPMFFLPPIVGFFLTYLAIDWLDGFLGGKAMHEWYFPVIVLILGFIAYYVALFWFWCNNFTQSGSAGLPFCSSDGAKITLDFVGKNFISLLKGDAFLPFLLSIILGWISHLVVERTRQK